jgi:23S rRNA (uracil1939-C5)-methyltransferase
LGSDGATMLNMTLDDEDAPELSADFATSVNIILPDNEPVNLVGDSHITYRVGERDFRLTAGGFFRAHVAQMDALIGEVLGALQLKGDERVLDLYAGTGVFSAFLAPRAELVTLVESYPPLATDADANLADYDNVDVVEGSVEAVLSSLQDAEENYDVALVDPPSNGMSDSAKQTLIQMGVKHIAYVSSNPATLGADIQDFMKAGYKLKRLQPFDFAPHTYYVEGFALLEKA